MSDLASGIWGGGAEKREHRENRLTVQESIGKESDGVKAQGKRMTDSCGYRDGAWLVVAGSGGGQKPAGDSSSR